MKCIICRRNIKAKESRTYATFRRNNRIQYVYACMNCQDEFDKYLDARSEADAQVSS